MDYIKELKTVSSGVKEVTPNEVTPFKPVSSGVRGVTPNEVTPIKPVSSGVKEATPNEVNLNEKQPLRNKRGIIDKRSIVTPERHKILQKARETQAAKMISSGVVPIDSLPNKPAEIKKSPLPDKSDNKMESELEKLKSLLNEQGRELEELRAEDKRRRKEFEKMRLKDELKEELKRELYNELHQVTKKEEPKPLTRAELIHESLTNQLNRYKF